MLMENITETFVINLKECKKRLYNIDKNLGHFGIKYNVWIATKGSDLTESELNKHTSYICKNIICNNGIIGCHMSHLLLWKHIAKNHGNSPNKWFLILEDDAEIEPRFIENLQGVFKDISNWKNALPEFVHLSCETFCKEKKVSDYLFKSSLINTTRAYMLSAAGAYKLSQAFIKIHYHVDVMMSIKYNLFNIIEYYTTNNFVKANDNMQSTVSANSFPRLIPDIVTNILNALGVNETFHIVYDSSIISIDRTVNINIMVFVFITIIGLLLADKMYLLAVVYVVIEVAYWVLIKSLYQKMPC